MSYYKGLITLSCIFICSQLFAQCGDPITINSGVTFDLNQCYSNTNDNSNNDYSEFAGEVILSSSCQNLISPNGVYRDNPGENPHSCTPGFDGNPGMCVGVEHSCDYTTATDQSVIFDVVIEPKDNPSTINFLSFYEAAPNSFQWIGGMSGPNAPPTLYALRVLLNGAEIYHEWDLATSPEWSLEMFDFSNNPNFTVTELSLFEFQLTAYCVQDIQAGISVWDLDEITVATSCETNPTGVLEGGSLDGGPFSFCGDSDFFIPTSNINLTVGQGTVNDWVVTSDGMIVYVGVDPYSINYGAFAGTNIQIWNISHEGNLVGLESGTDIQNIQGCYGLSNPIDIESFLPGQCTLTGGPIDVCPFGEGTIDIGDVNVNCVGDVGAGQWIITDDLGVITGLPQDLTDFNFALTGSGSSFIWYVNYDGSLTGAEIGNNAQTDIDGCYELSNPVEVVPTQLSACTLTGGPFEFCIDDNVPDFISQGELIAQCDNNADACQWVITSDDGIITHLPTDIYDFNFGALTGSGTHSINAVCYSGFISGLEPGNQLPQDLFGCYSVSNSIPVSNESVDACSIVGGPFDFCWSDGSPDLLPDNSLDLNCSDVSTGLWVVTDDNGDIFDLIPSPYNYDYSLTGSGTTFLWFINFNDPPSGLIIGNNALDDLQGCYGLSNPVTLDMNDCPENLLRIEGGPFNLCIENQPWNFSEDLMNIYNHAGVPHTWMLTNSDHIVAFGEINTLSEHFTLGNNWVSMVAEESIDYDWVGKSRSEVIPYTHSSNEIRIWVESDCSLDTNLDMYASDVHIYPNPSSNTLFIEMGESFEEIHLRVYDYVGKLIEDIWFHNEEELQLQVGHYPNGMYNLLIDTERRLFKKNFVKSE